MKLLDRVLDALVMFLACWLLFMVVFVLIIGALALWG